MYKLSKNTLASYEKRKTHNQKIKPMKFGKELGTTYCLGCKDFTHNFRPHEVTMTNKVLRKNRTVLFVAQIRFSKQNTATTKNNSALYKLML